MKTSKHRQKANKHRKILIAITSASIITMLIIVTVVVVKLSKKSQTPTPNQNQNQNQTTTSSTGKRGSIRDDNPLQKVSRKYLSEITSTKYIDESKVETYDELNFQKLSIKRTD